MNLHQTTPGSYVDANGKTKIVLFELLEQKREHEIAILIQLQFDLNGEQDGMNLLGSALRHELFDTMDLLL